MIENINKANAENSNLTIEEEIRQVGFLPTACPEFHELLEVVYEQEKLKSSPIFLAMKMYWLGKNRGKREERQRRAKIDENSQPI